MAQDGRSVREFAPRRAVQADLMADQLRHPAADGEPMAGRPAVINQGAVRDPAGPPSDDAVRLDAVFRDQLGGVAFDKRRRLAPFSTPAR